MSPEIASPGAQVLCPPKYGALFGLLPFLLAKRRNRKALGLISMIMCVILGALLSAIVAGISAAVFAVLVLLMGKAMPQDFKHGLPESKRKEIFRTIVIAEEHADVESKSMHPLPDSTQPDYSQTKVSEQLNKQTHAFNSLAEKYKSEVAEQYCITQVQFEDISAEGLKKNWP